MFELLYLLGHKFSRHKLVSFNKTLHQENLNFYDWNSEKNTQMRQSHVYSFKFSEIINSEFEPLTGYMHLKKSMVPKTYIDTNRSIDFEMLC